MLGIDPFGLAPTSAQHFFRPVPRAAARDELAFARLARVPAVARAARIDAAAQHALLGGAGPRRSPLVAVARHVFDAVVAGRKRSDFLGGVLGALERARL